MGGCPYVSVRIRTVLVFFGPSTPAISLEGGRWKRGVAFSFIFTISLSVRPQFRQQSSSTNNLLLSLSVVYLAFNSFSFILRVEGHRGNGGMFGWKGRWGRLVCAFLYSSLAVGLPSFGLWIGRNLIFYSIKGL